MEVTLEQVLAARDKRVSRIETLINKYRKTAISFTMNIPGPVKISSGIKRCFQEGCSELDMMLEGKSVLHRECLELPTGCEAVYVLDAEAESVKRIAIGIEDSHPLGRLFDIDVIASDFQKFTRDGLGFPERGCIVCGREGRACASRRMHGLPELQEAVNGRIRNYYSGRDCLRVAQLAVRSLLDELHTTPKPGLVDMRNCGSHSDMDAALFRTSALSLEPYFTQCVRIGIDTQNLPPSETFARLRRVGIAAEQTMFSATNGVNTHKGAVFTLGILCGAAGRLWNPAGKWQEECLFDAVTHMTRESMVKDFLSGGGSVGHRLYAAYGIRGIRGQVSDGLPAVSGIGLPVYRTALERGETPNAAGVRTLLELIARVEDTNMIARGGLEGAREAACMAQNLLKQGYTLADVEALDEWFIQRNLSPGGCADLLAAVYFVSGLNVV